MLSFFPRGVLDEILNLIESVSEGVLPTLGVRENGCVRFAVKRRTPMPRLCLLYPERFVYRLTPDYSDHVTGQTSCSSEKSATGE